MGIGEFIEAVVLLMVDKTMYKYMRIEGSNGPVLTSFQLQIVQPQAYQTYRLMGVHE